MSFNDNTSSEIDDPALLEMPFGRHVGVPVADMPRPYLRWAYATLRFTHCPELQRAIERCLGVPPDPQIRTGTPAQPPREAQTGPKVGSNGGYWVAAETGLDGLRRALERAQREALLEVEGDSDMAEVTLNVIDKVRQALGI